MRIDGVMAVRAGAVVLWAVAFGALWLSGAADRFVGPKTAWIVPAGTIGLTLVALALLPAVARPPYRSAPRGEIVGAIVFVLPVLAIAAVPDAQLGALAAQQRADAGATLVVPDEPREGPLDLLDVAFARQDADYALSRGVEAGEPVVLVGFVSRRRDDGFDVTRFRIMCCAADAVPFSARVLGAPVPERDQWVRVRGRLTPGLAVRATGVQEVARPSDPYGR